MQQQPQGQAWGGNLGPSQRHTEQGAGGRRARLGWREQEVRLLPQNQPPLQLPSPPEHRGSQSQRQEGGLVCHLVRGQRPLGGSCKDTGHAAATPLRGGGHHPLWDPDGISTPWGTQAARFSLPLALHVPSTAAQLCKEPRALGAEHPQLALCLPQASVCRHPSGHVDVIPVRAEDPRVSWLPLPGALQKHHPRLRSHMGCSKPVSAKVVL